MQGDAPHLGEHPQRPQGRRTDPEQQQRDPGDHTDHHPLHRVAAHGAQPVEAFARVVHGVEPPQPRHLVHQAVGDIAEHLEQEERQPGLEGDRESGERGGRTGLQHGVQHHGEDDHRDGQERPEHGAREQRVEQVGAQPRPAYPLLVAAEAPLDRRRHDEPDDQDADGRRAGPGGEHQGDHQADRRHPSGRATTVRGRGRLRRYLARRTGPRRHPRTGRRRRREPRRWRREDIPALNRPAGGRARRGDHGCPSVDRPDGPWT